MVAKAILALIVMGCGGAHAQSGPVLNWTQHPTLTWTDFKGQPPKSVSYPSAVSDTGFRYQLACRNGLLDIDAAAFFSPGGSWARPDGRTPELLRHEQGHFDMAELYALRLRKAIQDAKIGCEGFARHMTSSASVPFTALIALSPDHAPLRPVLLDFKRAPARTLACPAPEEFCCPRGSGGPVQRRE